MPCIERIDPGVLETIVQLRHEIHAHPELGFDVAQTAERILQHISTLPGLTIRKAVGGHGIVATLNADRPGRCVALRADMDALPLDEETDVPYRSTVPGRMHACGHDGNVACLVGAAMMLSQQADQLPGKVKFIFQPAEEGGGGGRVMCEEGALEDPHVDAAFALHAWPVLALGQVGVRSGPTLASTDTPKITIQGAGGHGAHPDMCVDPVIVAAHVVLALQTISSRFTSPTDPVVVTISQIHTGTTHNIIPTDAYLEGTIRALTPDVRTKTGELIRQLATQTAAAFGARADVVIEPGYPPLINDLTAAGVVADIATELVGHENVVLDEPPSMGGEDFAYYAERVPAAMWRLGVRSKESDSTPGLHTPRFDFNDQALPLGVAMHTEIATCFLNEG
jgi:amidohydrolase